MFILVGVALAALIVGAALILREQLSQPAAPLPSPEAREPAETVIVREMTVIVPATAPPTPTPAATYTPFPTYTPLPSPTPRPTPTPVPLPEWRELGHLVSMEYVASTVVERERPREGLTAILPGRDRVMLLAYALVRMGVDLSQLKPADVQVQDGNRIRVRLPPVDVLSVELLPARSEVYDSSQRWLLSEYAGLEVEALDIARARIREQAHADEAMRALAERLIRAQLSDFLRRLGFVEVDVCVGC